VFDSFISPLDNLCLGESRLLGVDSRLVLPVGVNVRLCVTSVDVIHSWALPFLSVKLDAIPGVLNTLVINFISVGVYYGQCREICGSAHTYIPICVEVVP
jgi:heme/copper-type cytochrome/quinol oxidase subunit 2